MYLEKAEIKKKITSSQKDLYLMSLLSNLLDEVVLTHVDQDINEFLGCMTYNKDSNRLELEINQNIQNEELYMIVIKHELLHLAMGHMLIIPDYYNRMLLNIALDAEINSYLVDEFKKAKYKLNPVNYMVTTNTTNVKEKIKSIEKSKISDKSYEFWSGKLNVTDREHWKNIYDFIVTNVPDEIKDMLNQMMKQVASMLGEKTEGTGNGSQSSDQTQNSNENNTGSGNNHDNKSNQSKSNNPAIQSNDKMLNENCSNNPFAVAAIEEAVQNAVQKLKEDTKNPNIDQPGSELGNLICNHFDFKRKPVHVWKKKLKNVIYGSIPSLEIESSYKRLDRRLHSHSARLPGIKYLYKPMINIVVDISGSMIELVPQVLRHLYSIGEQLDGINEIRFCDVETRKVCNHITKSELKNLKMDKISGWGGTSLAGSIKESVSQHPDIFVLITDLELWGDDFKVINESCSVTKTIICTDKNKAYASKHIKTKYDHIDLNLIE